ncbi:hypothetical protein IU438_07480 [Nocardia cyriacigeorgica]|uniref:hypothetical protein n=1 Tax=Nocardia cyriacigeorgica TaxID=135487 RepID=UPI0018940C1F|nr:hypothetical protein [Nocardia cyriacigeorgica]MBF6395629.1 hypothetical protein [Nocardia cyriacigeorgica]MBF6401261.1 hypothetical protein [Nocardia cyriacigeorgica]
MSALVMVGFAIAIGLPLLVIAAAILVALMFTADNVGHNSLATPPVDAMGRQTDRLHPGRTRSGGLD